MARKPGCLVPALVLVWIGILVLGVAYAGLLVALGDTACPHPRDDSEYGELHWSLFPPGPACRYDEPELDEPAGPVMSLWLLTLAGGAVGIRRLGRGPAAPT